MVYGGVGEVHGGVGVVYGGLGVVHRGVGVVHGGVGVIRGDQWAVGFLIVSTIVAWMQCCELGTRCQSIIPCRGEVCGCIEVVSVWLYVGMVPLYHYHIAR